MVESGDVTKKWNGGIVLFRILKLMIVLIFTLMVLGSCSNASGNTDTAYQKISAEEAKNRMEENKEAIVVDVRTDSEYNEGHIEGAVLIPNETIKDTPPEQLPDFDAEILVYCRSGNRSQQAAEKLIKLGYTNVSDFGGIIDWPYEIVTN